MKCLRLNRQDVITATVTAARERTADFSKKTDIKGACVSRRRHTPPRSAYRETGGCVSAIGDRMNAFF